MRLQNVRNMVARIRKVQILNDQIFTTLNKYLHAPSNDQSSHYHNAEIHHFEPPKPKLADIPTPDVTSSPKGLLRRGTTQRGAVRDSIDLIDEDFDDEEDRSHVRHSDV